MGTKATLRIKSNGTIPAKEYALSCDDISLGRHPSCKIVLDSGSVSREHARIRLIDDQYYIEDLKSRNGTFLNGQLTNGREPIYDSDTIRLCDVELEFSSDKKRGMKQTLFAAPSLTGSSSVVLSDEQSENPLVRVKSQISLDANRPLINIANAEQKLRALIDIGRNIGASVKDVLPQILSNLLTIFRQADCAYILMHDADTGRLELKAFRQRNQGQQESFRISRTVLETVAKNRSAILSDDVANDSRFDPSDSIVNFHIYSIMAVPIMDSEQNRVLGVIQVDCRTGNGKFSYDDLDLLVSVAYPIGIAYENALLHESRVRDEINERELNVAFKVQKGFLPDGPPKVDGYDFFGFYQPAKHLGGDYYDYIPLCDGKIAIALGDVSGKGAPAALLMAKLSAEVRYGLLVESCYAKTMSRLNRAFADPRWENRFITFALAVLDPKTHRVVFFNAGHMAPTLMSPGKPVLEICPEKTGLPLGIMDDTEYAEFEITLEPGQKIAFYSDGLLDAMNANGEFFAKRAVHASLSSSSEKSAEEIGQNLVSSVRSFAGRTDQTDDQCLVIFGRL